MKRYKLLLFPDHETAKQPIPKINKKATKGGFGDFNNLTTMCQALPTHIAFENV